MQKQKNCILYFPSVSNAQPLLGRQGLNTCSGILGKTNAFIARAPPSPSPPAFIDEPDIIWNILLVNLGQLSLPTSCPAPFYWPLWPGVGDTALMLYHHGSATARTVVPYQHHSSCKCKAQPCVGSCGES